MAQKKKAASQTKKAPAKKAPVKKTAAKKAPMKKAAMKKSPMKKASAKKAAAGKSSGRTRLLKAKSPAPSKRAGLPGRPGHFGPTPSTVTLPPMPIGRRNLAKRSLATADTCLTPPPPSSAPLKDTLKKLGNSPTPSTITMPP